MDKIFNLADFDKYREDNRLEVKKAKGGLPLSLWDTYSAMCNTYGGVIICGVQERDDKSWFTTGLKDVSSLKKAFWDTINNSQKVSINLLTEDDVQDYEVDGDVIFVINVPRAPREERPVYLNDNFMRGSFKRNYEGDYHCTPREVKAMLRDQANETPDMKVLEDLEISDLDADTVRAYRIRYDTRHEDSAWTRLSDEEFLVQIGGAARNARDGKVHPTAAGLLMFGQEYNIIREFPHYFLDYREMLDGHGKEICQVTMPQAFTCFFEGKDFEDVIRNCISIGGDSDTIAAIAGGIAEACYEIPAWMVERVMMYLPLDLLEIIGRFAEFTHDGITDLVLEEAKIRRYQENADREMEMLWEEFREIPVVGDCIAEDFLNFLKGTEVTEVIQWFDMNYPKGIYHLMFGRYRGECYGED